MNITIVKGPSFQKIEKEVYAYLAKVLPEQYEKIKGSENNEKAS